VDGGLKGKGGKKKLEGGPKHDKERRLLGARYRDRREEPKSQVGGACLRTQRRCARCHEKTTKKQSGILREQSEKGWKG